MKAIRTKWKKNGEEIDAYVHISSIVITKGRFPSGRSGGSSSGPLDYGSMINYYISEDKEGKVVISQGQAVDNFDMDGISSIKDFAIDALKKIPHLQNIIEKK